MKKHTIFHAAGVNIESADPLSPKTTIMKRLCLLFIFSAFLFSFCSTAKKTASNDKMAGIENTARIDNNTFELTAISSDDTYGYTKENPIKVGGAKQYEGLPNVLRFLNALLGPSGESIKYLRRGSCCNFETPNGYFGGGLLDMYEVTYAGLEKPAILYINMYDKEPLKAPKGFTFKISGNMVWSRTSGVPSHHADSK